MESLWGPLGVGPLAALEPSVPKELCDLIDELLRREPSMRPPTSLVVGNRLQALRVGLAMRAREKLSSKTEVRNLKEMTSIDMNDDASLMHEVKSISPNESTLAGPTQHSSSGIQGGTSASNPSIAGPDDSTRLAPSQSAFELSEQPSGIENMGKTNFTEVQDEHRRRTTTPLAEHEHMSAWTQWLSIGGLIATLIACGFGIFWLSQAPSANKLYQAIAVAMETSDEDQLLAIEPTAEQFKGLYPSDPRCDDVDALLREIDSLRSIRQMQRKAKRGGTDQLDAVEQAFLECIKAQSIDSILAQRKLNALVTVFSANEKLTQRQRQIVDLAKRMADKAASEVKPARHPAIESLEEQMIWAEANLAPTTRAIWLQGLIELFDDKAWARELVASAKLKLTAIENTKN